MLFYVIAQILIMVQKTNYGLFLNLQGFKEITCQDQVQVLEFQKHGIMFIFS
jgi:hypothetical protein